MLFSLKRIAEVRPALGSSAAAAPRSEILLAEVVAAIVVYKNECYRVRSQAGDRSVEEGAI